MALERLCKVHLSVRTIIFLEFEAFDMAMRLLIIRPIVFCIFKTPVWESYNSPMRECRTDVIPNYGVGR